ncbi:MAG: hypothetical protein ACTSU5_19660 [Promethearchaeota archaeon]
MDFELPKKATLERVVEFVFSCRGCFSIPVERFQPFVSFTLRLFPPSAARKVFLAAKREGLIEIDGSLVKASAGLEERVRALWRRDAGTTKIPSKTPSTRPPTAITVASPAGARRPSGGSFNEFIKALDPGKERVWAFKIPSEAVSVEVTREDPILLEATLAEEGVEGPLRITVDAGKRELTHAGCKNFTEKLAGEKKFCRHIMKLFLLLRKEKPEFASALLGEVGGNIQAWKFLGDS